MPSKPRPVHEVKANLFRVLGHPARVRILELLREEELSVGSLQAALDLDSGGTSQHLAALRRIGLVESRREGTSVYYRVDDPHVPVLFPLASTTMIWLPKLSRLQTEPIVGKKPTGLIV